MYDLCIIMVRYINRLSSPHYVLCRPKRNVVQGCVSRGFSHATTFFWAAEYRVGLVVWQLGWVDLDLECSTILLGQ